MRIFVHNTPSERRGSALALSLTVVTVVALLSAMMLQLSSAHWKREAAAVDQKRAFYIAEAGLAESIWGLVRGQSGIVGTQELPVRFGDGVYWTNALGDDAGVVHVSSTAMCGQARAKLDIAIELYYQNALNLGAFSAGNMTVGAGAYVDAYNSKNGPYIAPLLGLLTTPVKIGSNGDVSVAGIRGLVPTQILGSVIPGPNKSVSAGLGTLILGDTTPREEAVELPAILIPDVPLFGPMTVGHGATGTLPSGEYAGPNLSVASGGTGLIVGPAIVVVDTLSLAAGAKLRIDNSAGPVEIYVRQSMTTAAGSQIQNLNQNPRGLMFWLDMHPRTGGVLSLAHGGPFHGSMYAPKAPIAIPATSEYFGSVVSSALTIPANGRLHVDLSAGQIGTTDVSASVLHWRPAAVPAELTRDLRYEPLADFAERGIDLPAPSSAHTPIEKAVEYVDRDGETRVFRGTEAALDRSVIASLVEEVVQPVVRPITQVGRRRNWASIDDPVVAKLSPVSRRRGYAYGHDD
ncbi:MAG: hypothetical protein GC161_16510 [Planctomycetaceae bacterium]|nr:hypothetical protein [Planctomycetaceae bacterium]